MNWAQVKDRVSHMCLAGDVVASWSLPQDVAGSSPLMTNIFCVPPNRHWRNHDFGIVETILNCMFRDVIIMQPCFNKSSQLLKFFM